MNKKGVSIMVGYVLLISVGLIMGVMVYQWLKTYVPNETLECPDGVSVLVEETECSNGALELTLKNNGLFNIYGYYIRATFDNLEEIATHDLYLDDGSNIYSFPGEEGLKSGVSSEPTLFKFNSDLCAEGECNSYSVYSIEIVPVRTQKDSRNRETFVTCGNAKTKETVNPVCAIQQIIS